MVPESGRYAPDGRTLSIVVEHAELIRHIYQRYVDLGNVRRLAEELAREGRHAPVRARADGAAFGGLPLSRGQLYAILKNPIYVGHVPHKELSYPGLHKAIVERDVWDRVQAMLADHLLGERRATRAANPGLLAGLLIDEAGEPLISTHASKPVASGAEGGKVRYRYYVSKSLQDGTGGNGLRIPAREIEAGVAEALAAALDDPLDLICRASLPMDIGGFHQAFARAAAMAAKVRGRDRDAVRDLVRQVRVHAHEFEISVAVSAIATMLDLTATADPATTIMLEVPVRLTRTGRSLRLIQDDGRRPGNRAPETTLLKLLVKARRWWIELRAGEIDIAQLARREGVTDSYMRLCCKIGAVDTVRESSGVDGGDAQTCCT